MVTPKSIRTTKTIVLDLDETLIHAYDDIEQLKEMGVFSDPKYIDLRRRIFKISFDQEDENGDAAKYQMWAIERPYLRDFLEFCTNYFQHVIVWSAGIKPYVREVVKHIFRGLDKPKVVYSREKCEGKKNLYKPLRKLIDENPHLDLDLTQMFALDDRCSTFKDNYENGILLPPFHPPINESGYKGTQEDIEDAIVTDLEILREDDHALVLIMQWLLKPSVSNVSDTRVVLKPFYYLEKFCD